MSANGALLLVLQSHIPYMRTSKKWLHPQAWFHELMAETYLPLLQTLHDLKADAAPYRLTLSLSPILCEQLADPIMLAQLDDYLTMKSAQAKQDMNNFSPDNVTQIDDLEADAPNVNAPPLTAEAADPQLYYVAEWHKGFYEQQRHTLNERFNRDLIGAFRSLQDEGYIEILASAATHAYLPLLATESAVRAQIEVGIAAYERHFQQKPRGVWLPECAYAPGIETLLADYDLAYFFTETHAITGGQPVGIAAGDIIGPQADILQKYVVPPADQAQAKRTASTFLPYFVSVEGSGSVEENPHSGVVAIGRNNITGQQVWSNDFGYPGDFDYRELERKAGTSGLRYWRVTGAKVDLENKDSYHPDWADFKVEQHAEHFSHMVGDQLRDYNNHTSQYGVIAASFTADLFGHLWFEGISWLAKVLRHLSTREDIDLYTPNDFVAAYPPEYMLQLPESSWGVGGSHFIWDNGENHWMWEPIHAIERRMQALADQFTDPDEATRCVLQQAAREVLLLQSADWLMMITSEQAAEYAVQRFTQHVERFERLAASLEAGQPDEAYAERLYQVDTVFAELDYRVFRTRSQIDS